MAGLFFTLSLSGCDAILEKLGLESSSVKATRLEGEGKAVGGACRQSGRAIEDCYSIYSWLPKAAIYEGWRDMDAYMRENKLPTIEPQLPPPQPPETRKKKEKKEKKAVESSEKSADSKESLPDKESEAKPAEEKAAAKQGG
ncbi:MAG TPA: hypothetical protein PLB97_06955 [Accumulibacter sp.]|jgi:hypothetical protein|nr:hypothetical protein [Accumulibacter sp.]HPP47402.1 hypothetical protein [Accumulibacter sp.]